MHLAPCVFGWPRAKMLCELRCDVVRLRITRDGDPMIYLVGVWHVYFGDRRRLRCTEGEGVLRPEELVRSPVLIAGRVLVWMEIGIRKDMFTTTKLYSHRRFHSVMYSNDGLRGPKPRPSARASSSIYLCSARIMDCCPLYA